jgi:hypothetical protein
VSPISLALAVAAGMIIVGVIIVGWLIILSGRGLLSRRSGRSARAAQPTPLEASGVRQDWIYGDRELPARHPGRPGTRVAEAALSQAEREAAESVARARSEAQAVREKARRDAEAIVQAAEAKAGESLVEVERARGRLEREVQRIAREQALMTAKHKKLSELLLSALEEIERASANGAASIHDIGGLQEELRDTLRGTAHNVGESFPQRSIPAGEAGSPDQPTR